MPERPRITFSIKDIPAEIISVIGECKSIEFPVQGQVSDVGCVVTDKGSFALKRIREKIEFLGDPGAVAKPDLQWLEREHLVLSRLHELGLPVPQPYAYVRLGTPPDEEAWLAMSCLPGEPLFSGADNREEWKRFKNKLTRTPWGLKAMETAGRLLATVHHCAVPSELAEPKPDIFSGAINMLEEWLRDAEKDPKRGVDAEDYRDRIRKIDSMRASYPKNTKTTLIHGDYSFSCIMAIGDRPTGIVDWSSAGEGDPRYDIARILHYRSADDFMIDDLVRAFFEGYGADPLQKDEIIIYQKLWEIWMG